mmetsp:Transcript_13643/g.29265  ORF Transcript_13643/g.29265 Transcript_13643/m.29265 type:complete len:265 (+) Transcript_13643:174-968(+)|eukprot:CAMPEP_0202891808 /NCGR_PEP_ID=MMETSP1392-20130828/1773_1 /ASSEMBLY_ACC=CAM_ASM_000868 /TAXON_ID=225041 /ORGANISM="Chlamydomonas chlamydogama, Strain SAG 11-48b" /LENGTH=264 /DNA_ID=CAMNT_0049575667 /DNA_START=107 /DNA_END=901 /DNA_ORIENTATION=-
MKADIRSGSVLESDVSPSLRNDQNHMVSTSEPGAADAATMSGKSVALVTTAPYEAMKSEKKPNRSGTCPHVLRLETAAAHLITAGAGWAAVSLVKLFRRQHKKLKSAKDQLQLAHDQLEENETKLKKLQDEMSGTHGQAAELTSAYQNQLDVSRQQLQSATGKCHEAVSFLESTMSDLRVTQTELRAARAQLQSAFEELTATKNRLENTQGELGLTRSENILLKRELDTTRKQLEATQRQMERFHMDSRSNQRAGLSTYGDDWD